MSVLCSEVFLVEWAIIIRYIDVVEEKKASLLSSTNLSSLLTFYWCDNSCGVSRCKAKRECAIKSNLLNSYLGEIIKEVSKYLL